MIELSWFSCLTPGKSGAMMVLFYTCEHCSSIAFNNIKAVGLNIDFFTHIYFRFLAKRYKH